MCMLCLLMNPLETHAVHVAEVLQNAGFTTYFAGGCVRDRLLGRAPRDYDLATSATPDEVLALFSHTHELGKAFGVVQVLMEGHAFEVASFRSDQAYIDGRHPSGVRPASPQEDAARRDFTINGMFLDPVTEEIFDYVDGQADLKQRSLRSIGDATRRFEEDHLRMLRALRFAGSLDFEIEATTLRAIIESAALIQKVSAERVQVELTRLLCESARPGASLQGLHDSGLLAQILPELLPLIGQEQPPQFHPEGDVWTHTRIMLDLLPPSPCPRLAWSVLLHDIGKPPTAVHNREPDGSLRWRFNRHAQVGAEMADAILRRLKFSKADREAIVHAVDNHMKFGDVGRMKDSTIRKLIACPGFENELELHRVDCQSSHGLLDNYERLLKRREEIAAEPVLPQPLVSGGEIMEQLGLQPGPEVGKWKDAVFDQQLEAPHWSKEQLLEWLAKKNEEF